ncbi:MAG: pilus assembly protein PilZ [Sulfurospirillaceae bacterium]|jgi:GGDEF domain-containing protein|nr:pilus assembly protein PilZ [Sulfurospirillaceae bacterium]MDD2827795.1 pilus assembly protein PilZ [Sulfurospirillaceae bacterium]
MILEQFVSETYTMSIAHLYFDEKKLDIFDALAIQHPNFSSFDLSNHEMRIPNAQFLFIEIGESSKEKLKVLVGLLSKNKPIATYIFAEDVENRLLLKFALHFGIVDVLPLRNDDAVCHALFAKNVNKLDTKLDIHQKVEREHLLGTLFPFFIFTNDHLTYANNKALSIFETTNLSEIEEGLYSEANIIELLQTTNERQTSIVLEDEMGQKMVYICHVKHFAHVNQKILTMMHYDAEGQNKNCSSVLNRFDFIEKLKDKLAQQSLSHQKLSLILINISNLDKLNKTFSNTTLYEAFKNFLMKIIRLKAENQDIVQWSPNLYLILCEDFDFEQTCEQTRYIQQELINTTAQEKVTPVILSSALMLQKMDLNEAITYIEKVNTKSMLHQDIQKIDFYEVEYLEHVVEEKEQIAYLMRNCINNKIPLKLLNIYKGLCINTNSSVLKINDDSYYLHCENLQGYAMQIEGETVIQAPNFPKDIKAEVSIVDIKKAFVILKNLNFLPNSANSRQHTRVQTSIRTPIILRCKNKSSFQGEVLDISVNSIAMKLNKLLKEDIRHQIVKLSFSLPSEENENGYVVMDIEGKVSYLGNNNEHTKIVVMLGALPKPFDEYLLKYMYTRQKELILEIRRATKAYN